MIGVFGSSDVAHAGAAASHATIFSRFFGQFGSLFSGLFGSFRSLLLRLLGSLLHVFQSILFQFGEVFCGPLWVLGCAGFYFRSIFLITDFVPQRSFGRTISIARGSVGRFSAVFTAGTCVDRTRRAKQAAQREACSSYFEKYPV